MSGTDPNSLIEDDEALHRVRGESLAASSPALHASEAALDFN